MAIINLFGKCMLKQLLYTQMPPDLKVSFGSGYNKPDLYLKQTFSTTSEKLKWSDFGN